MMSVPFVYIVPGNPTPLLRTRHSVKTNHVYNSQKIQQQVMSINLQEQHGDKPLFEGPLHIDIIFYMPITKSNESQRDKVKPGQWHKVRPDTDNLCKFVLDLAQPNLFLNDALVSKLTAKKIYDLNPRTEFTIVPLK